MIYVDTINDQSTTAGKGGMPSLVLLGADNPQLKHSTSQLVRLLNM